MKLSEKILYLRKSKHMTQEELAEHCGVSRQAVTKWELDISLPETEKILLLGQIFGVTTDVLLKDELTVGAIRQLECSQSCLGEAGQDAVYDGILIKI